MWVTAIHMFNGTLCLFVLFLYLYTQSIHLCITYACIYQHWISTFIFSCYYSAGCRHTTITYIFYANPYISISIFLICIYIFMNIYIWVCSLMNLSIAFMWDTSTLIPTKNMKNGKLKFRNFATNTNISDKSLSITTHT